jgi:hypothetical protein
VLRKGWLYWIAFAKAVGNVQSRGALTFVYFFCLLPFAVLVKLTSDPLHLKHSPTGWLPPDGTERDIVWAHRQ